VHQSAIFKLSAVATAKTAFVRAFALSLHGVDGCSCAGGQQV
jgi:hypothetical protein